MSLPPRKPLPHDLALRTALRYPFFLGAVAIHGVALLALSQLQTSSLTEARLRLNQTQIEVHTQAAAQQGMRRRVDSLKAMKSLAERIERAQAEAEAPAEAASQVVATVSAPPAATPQEMLAQARELRDSIRRLEEAAQAKKLADTLKLTPEQALQKLREQSAEARRREAAADAVVIRTPEQVIEAMNRYEQQSRDAIQRLQAQHAQARDGTSVQGGAHAAGQGGATARAGQGAGGAAQPGRPGVADGSGAGGAGGGTVSAEGPAGRADGRRSTVREAQERAYDGQQASPAVDTRQLRLGGGNRLGPGGVYANRVFVDRWYVIGPFHAPSAESMKTIYPPEQYVDLDGVYLGKGKRVLRWQYVSSASYPLIPPDEAEQAIYYGYAEIVSDRPRTVSFGLGADDDARLWLNDQLVWTSGNQRKAWYTNGGVQSLKDDIRDRNLIEARVRVTLQSGRNTVLFKLYNNPLDVFFSLVIEPVDGGG
jgi:hypothetical protein